MKKRICKKMLGILFCMLLLGTSITLAGLNSDTKKTSDFNELSNQTMDESNERYMSQEIIIKFKEPPKNDVILFENGILNTGFSSVDDILNTKYHVIAAETVFNRNKASVGDTLELQLFYKFTLSEEQDIFLAIDEVNKNSFVAYAGPNNIMTTCRIPDDPYYYSHGSWCNDYMDLYGMHLINTSAAWDISTGGDDVVVAVVDTGVDYNHGDIATNMWINEDEDPTNGIDDDGDGFIDNIYGADFINNDGDPLDDHWHGTHCAGTIAGVGNNSLGVVGVNWQCRIMAVKGLSNTGFGSSETLANAIVWAADNGADVISNSWSHYTRVPSDPVVEAAVHYAYDAGCVIVFAAGNNEDDVQYYCPQNMDETITVAATDWNDVKAWFSNWGELVDVCAPGIYILSLRAEGLGTQWRVVGENYYIASGTSMACPHVAGLAALLLSLVPHLSNTEVAERIISMTDNIDVVNPDYVGLLGSGRINAFKTLQVFEHNIGVRSVDVPTHIKSNEMTYVNTTIFNNGNNDQSDVVVSFRVDDFEIDTITIPFFESETTIEISFPWIPDVVGIYIVSIDVSIPDVTEYFYHDNEQSQQVVVGVLNYDTSELFDTIQEAIDDPDTMDSHSILVPTGVYFENVVIDKELSLIGLNQSSTIIEGSGDGDSVVHILNANFVTLSGFTIRDEVYGVFIESSSNVIRDTNIVDNECGIKIELGGNDNCIYHNVFNNSQNAFDSGGNNQWDNGYYDGFHPDGGNYWSDYDGSDEFSGPDQDEPDPDGVGDTPYNISGGSNWDRYPLIEPPGNLPKVIYVDDDNTEGPWDGTQEHPYLYICGQNSPYWYMPAIPGGVNNARSGDKVFVCSGLYNEQVFIDKSIYLIGEDRDTTLIDGGRWCDVVHISADGVTISGFTIQNSGDDWYGYDAGIDIRSNYNNICGNNIVSNNRYGLCIVSSCNNTITGNNISNNERDGIELDSSSSNTITGNSISNNDYGIELESSSNNNITYNTLNLNQDEGIRLDSSSSNTITGNNILNNGREGIRLDSSSNNNITYNTLNLNQDDGIHLESSSSNTISDNTFNSNTRHGLELRHYCNNNTITGNSISNNDHGIRLDSSSNNNITGNNIISNNDHGIRLDSSSNNTITGNTISSHNRSDLELRHYSNSNTITGNNISNSDKGIELDSSSNNTIAGNNISNNNKGIELRHSSDYNSLYYNNFIDNQAGNAYDAGYNHWDDGSEGNYWDDYTGVDADPKDGIGDTPYNISGGSNQDRYPLMCPWPWILGDLDHDGDVDLNDLAQLLGNYGTTSEATYEMGDIDGDGDVDLGDLAALLGNYGCGI